MDMKLIVRECNLYVVTNLGRMLIKSNYTQNALTSGYVHRYVVCMY